MSSSPAASMTSCPLAPLAAAILNVTPDTSTSFPSCVVAVFPLLSDSDALESELSDAPPHPANNTPVNANAVNAEIIFFFSCPYLLSLFNLLIIVYNTLSPDTELLPDCAPELCPL